MKCFNNLKKYNYKKNILKIILVILLFVIFSLNTFGIEQYEKKDIVVLGISSNSQLVDIEYFYRIQSYIYKAFVDLKRFNIIYYPDISLPVSKTSQLIDDIKKYRVQNIDSEEDHTFGNLVFKKADFDKIVNSFYLIIPQINSYNENSFTNDDGSITYKVSYEVTIEIVDLKNNNILKEIIINNEKESDKSISDAQSNCLEGFITDLQYQIKNIEEFKLKTGVLKKEKDNVYIYLGSNSGVKVNDEFLIYKKVKFQNDFIKKQVGLIRIYETSEKISIGKILIETDSIEEGDIVVEKVRIPANVMVYLGYKFLNFSNININYYTSVNIDSSKGTIFGDLSLQYYLNFNLFIESGIEGYLTSPISYAYFGGLGYSLIYRRLTLSGMIGGQMFVLRNNLFSDTDYYYGKTFGARAELRLEYLINPESKLILGGNYILSGNLTEVTYVDYSNSKYNIPLGDGSVNFSGIGFYLIYVFRF